jgi:hypothetical protein
MSTDKRTCLLCGSADFNTILSFDRPDKYEKVMNISSDGYFRKWVCCKSCDFYFSIYSRSHKVLDKIYKKSYRDSSSRWRNNNTKEVFDKIINLPENESETKYRVKWIKDEIARHTDIGIFNNDGKTKLHLDIGGATGVFSYEFKDEKWDSYIIDPSDDGKFISSFGIDYLNEHYKPNCFDFKFDFISLVFVLEHLQDPESILNTIYNDLSDDGFLYIEVPDMLAFELKSGDDDIFNSCHLWMFDPVSLSVLLKKHGYRVISLRRDKTRRGHYALMVIASKIEYSE